MKIPFLAVPALIVVITAVAVWSTRLFAIPTISVDYEESIAAHGEAVTVTMTVRGIKCRDTARWAADNLADTPGILRFVAYASYNRVDLTYLPSVITVAELTEILEGPVYVEETGEFRFNLYSVLEVQTPDGTPNQQDH